MDKATAEKLLDHALTTTGADGAFIYRIANGELVVRIKAKDYWLWSFADLTAWPCSLETKPVQNRHETA